ncbi:hypothetical protein [Clostridium manihotivorum]|uniref:Uncharacterized protein n=1 Tax=Clostridium manihotivorum TaxID=2320868 RepID=A0A3R5QQY2_9CLOT|nr:hypothetical protein [Clostridium manihotivorum]QAA30382.1 hypothetical protein C1I91_01055 [Clostridium manihotivorum]
MNTSLIHWLRANDLKKIYRQLTIYLGSFFLLNYCGVFLKIFLCYKYGKNYEHVNELIILIYSVIMISVIIRNIKNFITNGEITFLKGVSYNDVQVCIIGLLRQRSYFYVLSCIYGVINFKTDILGIVMNLFGYLLLYLVIYQVIMLVFLSINISLIGKRLMMASGYILVALSCYKLFSIRTLLLNNGYITQTLFNNYLVRFILQKLYNDFSFIFFFSMFSCICFTVIVGRAHIYDYHINYHKVKFDNIRDLFYKPTNFNNAVIAHIIKDYFSLIRNVDFFILQVFSFLVYIIIALFNNDLKIYLIITSVIIYLNVAYCQELYKIEASNFILYKQLPIKYNVFVFSKIISVLFISTYQFILVYSIRSILLHQLLLVIVGLIVLSSFLSIYYNSILVMHYPKIDKTNIPMLVESVLLFIPVLPILLIYIALKRGYKNWIRYFYN